MSKFILVYSIAAKNDIEELTDVILYQYKAPLTAFSYVQELLSEINNLKNNADIFQIQTNPFLTHLFGSFVRRINYKKMAVLYTIHNQTVYIHRIVAQSLINEL